MSDTGCPGGASLCAPYSLARAAGRAHCWCPRQKSGLTAGLQGGLLLSTVMTLIIVEIVVCEMTISFKTGSAHGNY